MIKTISANNNHLLTSANNNHLLTGIRSNIETKTKVYHQYEQTLLVQMIIMLLHLLIMISSKRETLNVSNKTKKES